MYVAFPLVNASVKGTNTEQTLLEPLSRRTVSIAFGQARCASSAHADNGRLAAAQLFLSGEKLLPERDEVTLSLSRLGKNRALFLVDVVLNIFGQNRESRREQIIPRLRGFQLSHELLDVAVFNIGLVEGIVGGGTSPESWVEDLLFDLRVNAECLAGRLRGLPLPVAISALLQSLELL